MQTLTDEFCHREVVSIIERWHQISSDIFKQTGRASYLTASLYRLVICRELWQAIAADLKLRDFKSHYASPGKLKFLDLDVIVRDDVEGWNIVFIGGWPIAGTKF